jgi:hypothetical protein
MHTLICFVKRKHVTEVINSNILPDLRISFCIVVKFDKVRPDLHNDCLSVEHSINYAVVLRQGQLIVARFVFRPTIRYTFNFITITQDKI